MELCARLVEGSEQLTNWLLWHSKFSLLGRPPHVLPWHPAWPDFRTVLREIHTFFIKPNQRMLMLRMSLRPSVWRSPAVVSGYIDCAVILS